MPYLFIGPADKMGRGVFTAEAIPGGTVIEIAPVIRMTKEERVLLDQTALHDYIFEWEGGSSCCLALGYISIYNHSAASNCEYEMDYEHLLISIKTVRDINAGDELFINYNGDWNDQKPVWFDAK